MQYHSFHDAEARFGGKRLILTCGPLQREIDFSTGVPMGGPCAISRGE